MDLIIGPGIVITPEFVKFVMEVPALFRWLSRKYPSIVVHCGREGMKRISTYKKAYVYLKYKGVFYLFMTDSMVVHILLIKGVDCLTYQSSHVTHVYVVYTVFTCTTYFKLPLIQ